MSGGYNRGGYPPPAPQSARYSPTAATYGDNSNAFRPPMPPAAFPPFPPHSFPPPPIPPTNAAYRSPYEEYSGSQAFSAPPPKLSGYDPRNNQDAYDPYQPAAAYDPGAPQLRQTQTVSYTPPAPSAVPHRLPARPGDTQDLPLLTSPTSATVGSYTTAVYSLPPSHLPITKYVAVNPGDAIDLHRAICQTGMTQAIWYSDGQVRAGEGWGSAIEWVLETGMSGAKLRTCVGATDSLGTELGAIIKATEGFRDHLNQSIKTQKPMSHEFVLFTSSAAAIVSLDTSSRPESLQFCRLWREICTDFLKAHLTIIHLPKGSDVEGFVLAEKIANVAATNSYMKRKKDRMLDPVYNRPGGGEPSPGGSTEGGPWQRGDADPSRRKSPFDRPKPLPMSPGRQSISPPLSASTSTVHDLAVQPNSPHHAPQRRVSAPREALPREAPREASPREALPRPPAEPEEEGIQPREDALFVTHFPENACAKDIGILFAQFGDIVSVDIFSLPPVKPRFAFVAYADRVHCAQAIQHLHQRPIDLNTPFARENAEDLEIWKGWNGTLTVVESDGERLVPLSVAGDFPDLPPYATQRRMVPPTIPLKRERIDEEGNPNPDSSTSKRARADSDAVDKAADSQPSSLPPRPSGLPLRPTSAFDAPDHATPTPPPLASNGSGTLTHPLPPIPLTRDDNQSGSFAGASKEPLTAESSDGPVQISGKTLQAQIDLVQNVFVKHDRDNWIAHTCLIATDLDQIRRQLQADLYATDEAALTAKDLQSKLSSRGFSIARMDAFVSKVLKVLDGIAAEDEAEHGGPPALTDFDLPGLQAELARVLRDYPPQTREAMRSAATVLEYLNRGKDAQEAKRLEVERRVGVLEGMAQKGEQVTGVVRFLLSSGE